MPIIPYTASKFSAPFQAVNNGGSLTVTWSQLVWAAITVGKAAGDEYAYGIYSTAERIHRASMLWAYLRESTSCRLFQTMPYEMSDPSEKTSISFYLGMTLSKLFAGELFDVPRMLHYAVYKDDYTIVAKQGKSRPDLIGEALNGDWFVFEAKGRSNGIDQNALKTAKLQAKQIVSISSNAPSCRIAGQAFFDPYLSFGMEDPPHEDSDYSRRLNITHEKFRRDYDDPLHRIVDARGSDVRLRVGDRQYIGAWIEELDILIALPAESDGSENNSQPDRRHSEEYLGKDGTLIRLGQSWREENMKLEPHLRSA
jgi:hypothetical protein